MGPEGGSRLERSGHRRPRLGLRRAPPRPSRPAHRLPVGAAHRPRPRRPPPAGPARRLRRPDRHRRRGRAPGRPDRRPRRAAAGAAQPDPRPAAAHLRHRHRPGPARPPGPRRRPAAGRAAAPPRRRAHRRAGLVRHPPRPARRGAARPRVRTALRALSSPGATAVGAARAAGLSERQLRRLLLDHTGLGPRALQRVARLQRFLRAADTGPDRPLADLALIAGYADQPHLTREVRRMSGLTPAALFTERAAAEHAAADPARDRPREEPAPGR
ncbi:helix-turn-helix domain-containing protein [Nocardiopsis composta]